MNKNINFSKITWTKEKPKDFDLLDEYQNQVDSIVDNELVFKKDIDFLSSYIDIKKGKVSLEEVIEKYGIEKLIDLVFDEDIYRKITNYDGKLYRSKYTRYNGKKKTEFNKLVSYLIKENPHYYFEKLFSLDQNSFRRIVQKTHQTSILYAIYNYNIDENLQKEFAGKLLKNIAFYQIKDNRGDSIKKDNPKDNYYSLIQRFYPETFEKVNVNKLLTDNISFVPSDFDENISISDFFNKNNILDEILNLENGLELLLNTKNSKFFKEIFISKKFIDLILEQDEKTILKYIFLIQNNYFNLEDKLEEKLKTKIGKKLEILFQHNFVEFFSLFQNEINSSKEIEEKIDLLKKYLEDFYIEESFLTIFIKQIRKVKSFKFTIKYSDLNKELLESINENFSNISKYLDLSKINSFFDREINSYQDLENSLEKYFLTNEIDLDNLENLFKEFNLDFKISNLYNLEKEYNKYYKNTKENYVKIEKILVNNSNILTNIEFLNEYFSVQKKGEKKEITEEEFFNGLKQIGIELSDNLSEKIQNLTEKKKEKLEEILQGKKTRKEFNINQILNFLLLTKKYTLLKNGNFIKNIELLDKYLKIGYKENLILINGDSFELAEDFEEIYYKLSIYFSNFEIFLKNFNNLDLEKIIKFYDYFYKNHAQLERAIDYKDYQDRMYNDLDLEKIIGNYNNLNDFKKNSEKVKAFLVRTLIQKAINNGDYSNLIKNINNILNIIFFEKIIYEEFSKNRLSKILEITKGLLNESLIKKIIIGQDYNNEESRKNFLGVKFEDIIKKFKEITQINEEIKPKDFQDDTFIWCLEKAGYSIIGTENGNEFKKFFEYFPDNNGKTWKIEDFKKGGKLEKVFKYLDLSLKLIEKRNFNLDELETFYSYNIRYNIISIEKEKIFEYKNIFYGYFKTLFTGQNAYLYFTNTLEEIDINTENFTNYMGDDEVFLDYNKEGLKTNGIKPFSKAWFLEKPERKEYLEIEKIRTIKNYGLIIGLAQLGEDISEYVENYEKIELNDELEFCRQNFGFNPKELISYKGEGKDKKIVFRDDVLKNYYKIIYFVKKYASINDKEKFFLLIKKDKNLLNLGIKGESFIELSKLLGGDKEAINNIFNVESSGSLVLDNLIKELKNNPEKTLIEIMKEDVDKIFEKIVDGKEEYKEKEILENGQKIINYQKGNLEENAKNFLDNTKKLELALYIRYHRNNLNHPEIAEYIILFYEKLISKGYLKYFSGIKIIPRELDLFPSKEVLDSPIINTINVEGTNNFKKALHLGTIADIFSHSIEYGLPENILNSDGKDLPSIISSGMEDNPDCVKSKIELEDAYSDKSKKMTLEYILKEKFSNLLEIQNILNELSQN